MTKRDKRRHLRNSGIYDIILLQLAKAAADAGDTRDLNSIVLEFERNGYDRIRHLLDGAVKARSDLAEQQKPNGKLSKTALIGSLLTRPGGCTLDDVKKATGWDNVSMPAMAEANGLTLCKAKELGKPIRYKGVPCANS